MDEFDFIKGFADVDILSAEAVSVVIGHCVAKLYEGMVQAGLSEETAHRIISDVVNAGVTAMLRSAS